MSSKPILAGALVLGLCGCGADRGASDAECALVDEAVQAISATLERISGPDDARIALSAMEPDMSALAAAAGGIRSTALRRAATDLAGGYAALHDSATDLLDLTAAVGADTAADAQSDRLRERLSDADEWIRSASLRYRNICLEG
ncbi:hypothetical protein WDJ51_07890 [Rathayibacter sp. YIM 133350]|uniref:hypothetical protein n=1 Tax=Rathayibacter sp. YIM 133350 TaxID=3131992 RepID=UPI00307DCC2A